jgi:C-5 cytosine-specific DNA methylase
MSSALYPMVLTGGGGLTDKTHTAVAYLPSVANTLTRRMHKGINTTVDEGQTPIVTTGGVFSEVVAATGHPDPAYAISAGQQGKGGVFGSGRDSQDTFVVEANAVAFQSTLGTRGGDIYEDGSAPTVRVGSGVGIPSPPAVAFKPVQSEGHSHAVAFKPSHFTRGKDGKPSDVAPPLSADADKGDQDTIVAHSMRESGQGFWMKDEIAGTLRAEGENRPSRPSNVIATNAVGFNWQNGGGYGNANDGLGITEEGTGPLQRCNTPAVAFAKATNPHSKDEAENHHAIAFTTEQTPKASSSCAFTVTKQSPTGGGQPQCVAFTQNTRDEVRQINGGDQIAGALSAESGSHQTNYVAFKESQIGCRTGDVHATIDANKGSRRQEGVVAFAQNQLGEVRTNDEVMGTVNTNQNASGRNTAMVHQAMQVRRLTPTECCRLQGFPDDHCDITFRKKPAADGPKYRALGNSMAVPCMMWLGWRIHKATK